jgi:hypothetical protein
LRPEINALSKSLHKFKEGNARVNSTPSASNDQPRLRKTTLRTFRFTEELARTLDAEAQEQGMTLNALVSSILTKYVEWDAKAAKFGYIPTYKPIFEGLLQASDDESLDKMGRTVLAPMWKEMASFWYHDSSERRILDLLSMRSRHLPYVQTEVRNDGRKYTIVTHHDLGPKWSVVLHGALDELVRKSFHAQPMITVGDTVVTVEFSSP